MPEPTKCCCHTSDARECIRSRYPLDPDDQECECVCHSFSEDGENEWGEKLEDF